MSKTVKELADELGVTRQYIQKIISELPATKKPIKQQHRYIIDDQAESLIKAKFNNNSDNKETNKATKETNKVVNVNNRTIKALIDQLNSKDNEISRLHDSMDQLTKLLDQSQRLQLMAENKIEKLEQPKATNTTPRKEPKKQDQPESVKEEPKKKKGFWSRFR